MFIDRFTFNNNVTEDGRGSTVAIPNYENPKDKMYPNFIFKKRLSYEFKIEKMFGIVKKYIGFGDIIEFITKHTGIKYLIVKITKGNCGCEKRRKRFNAFLQIPYFSFYYKDTTILDVDNSIKHVKMFTSNTPPMDEDMKKEILSKRKPCGCGAKMTRPVETK